MNTALKWVLAVAVVVLLGGGYVALSGSQSFGGQYEEYDHKTFQRGLTVGENGSRIAAIKTGACTIWAPATTIAASSSQQAVCQANTNGTIGAITGITADSVCYVQNASSTNAISNTLFVAGASASSTAGTIVARISNLTGATFTWSATASSSSKWSYTCFDPV